MARSTRYEIMRTDFSKNVFSALASLSEKLKNAGEFGASCGEISESICA